MARRFAELTFTPGVQAAQARYGTRGHAERYALGSANVALEAREREFIAARNSFYLATASETGWPYVQHRGGATGFLHVLDAGTLAFLDLRGNLQYQSIGNLAHDGRVSLILVDYPQRRRLKILGQAQAVDIAAAAPDVLARLNAGSTANVAERVVSIRVEAFDWNCSQHITPRYTLEEMQRFLDPLQQRIVELERQLRETTSLLPATATASLAPTHLEGDNHETV